MKIKMIPLYLFLIMALLLASCGPSAEQAATMTAAAWTPTPIPPTSTPTPTPMPYDLVVRVTDAQGNPISGALVIFPQSGNEEPIAVNDSGQAVWSNLDGPAGTVTASAQGYFKGEQSFNLNRGPNEITLKLERDPFGLLPSDACGAGESLLYLEDFQDGEAQGWHGDENDQPASKYVASASDEEANSVWTFDATKLTYGPNAMLGANRDDYFGDAVWRMRFMVNRPTAPKFSWHGTGPIEFGGQELAGAGYSFILWGAPQNQLRLQRTLFGPSGTPVSDNTVITGTFTQVAMQWHQIELSSFQGHLQVWIDGKLELEYTDPEPLPQGRMGIWIGPFTDKSITVLYFDDIRVCGLSTPFASTFVTP